MNDIILQNNNGTIVTSSRDIANIFNKEHAKVLRAINDKIEVNPILASPKYFIENVYIDKSNRESKEYLLTRDGFSFIVMGFTGKEADSWKLKYIDAFNKMEMALIYQSARALPVTYKEALIQLLEAEEQREQLERENLILLPKANYCDEVLDPSGLLDITVIAKDLGFKSAKNLNMVMYLNRITFKDQTGKWKPYSEYEWLISDGYADYSNKNVVGSLHLKWTEKGRKWITDNFKKWEDDSNMLKEIRRTSTIPYDGNDKLSGKQKDALRYIAEYVKTNKFFPTVREIMESMGVKSSSTAHRYIQILESKGYIEKDDMNPRTIRINQEKYNLAI